MERSPHPAGNPPTSHPSRPGPLRSSLFPRLQPPAPAAHTERSAVLSRETTASRSSSAPQVGTGLRSGRHRERPRRMRERGRLGDGSSRGRGAGRTTSRGRGGAAAGSRGAGGRGPGAPRLGPARAGPRCAVGASERPGPRTRPCPKGRPAGEEVRRRRRPRSRRRPEGRRWRRGAGDGPAEPRRLAVPVRRARRRPPAPSASLRGGGGQGRAGAGRLLPHAAPGLAAPPARSPRTPCPSVMLAAWERAAGSCAGSRPAEPAPSTLPSPPAADPRPHGRLGGARRSAGGIARHRGLAAAAARGGWRRAAMGTAAVHLLLLLGLLHAGPGGEGRKGWRRRGPAARERGEAAAAAAAPAESFPLDFTAVEGNMDSFMAQVKSLAQSLYPCSAQALPHDLRLHLLHNASVTCNDGSPAG